MFDGPEPLWVRWERACDFLDADLESGYVRILQEMIAAGWSDPEVAAESGSRDDRRLVSRCWPTSPGGNRSAAPTWARSRPDEVAALMATPFLGAEELILLGRRRSRRCRMRSALRKLGAVLRELETRREQATTAVMTRVASAGSATAPAAAAARRGSRRGRGTRSGPAIVERDGGRIAYEVYGAGDPPIMFVPPWQIVHSRVWKAQIPDFARRHRVIAWDNRGNGRSDRPTRSARSTRPASAPPTSPR